MLKDKLNGASGIKQFERGMTRERVEAIQTHNEKIYSDIISNAFNERPVSCHVGPGTFWVYANTLDDAADIKVTAKQHGYRNMRTFEPHTTDDAGRRMPDPKGKYAVDISESTELIIGTSAPSFVKALKPFIEAAQEHLLHIYCHMSRMSIKLNDKQAAEELEAAIGLVFSSVNSGAGLGAKLKVTQECIDAWNLEVKLLVKEPVQES